MKSLTCLLRVLLFSLAATVLSAQQSASPRPAVPIEPIPAILEAFRSHQLVAISDAHGNEQIHAFNLSLIRDPRFAATVNDIVVECGSARYQDVIDRFIRGEDVPHNVLRKAWQNTTQPNTLWDAPIYEELFRTVRLVNMSAPRDRQLRVLLGDPPIDWDKVRTRNDLGQFAGDRDSHAADVVRREVLAKQRRALLIFGDQHLFRKTSGPLGNEAGTGTAAGSLVGQIEGTTATKVFTIATIPGNGDLEMLQADVLSWHRPSLAVIRGTTLGAADFAYYFRPPSTVGRGDKPSLNDPRRLHMEDQFDALVYHGPSSAMTFAQLSPALCADASYMEMRLQRMALLPGPPGAPNPGERLKQYCATVAQK